MARKKKIKIDKHYEENTLNFLRQIESDIYYKSDLSSSGLSFDWLEEVEYACPYIDNIVRNPKVALITEEEVLLIEKAKKVSVESVKNLAKNTHYIEKINPGQDVEPSKILVINREETFNTYENRFLYTLIHNVVRFVMKKEEELDALMINDDKVLEYKSSTVTLDEKVNIEMKMTTNELPKDTNSDKLLKEIEEVKKRIERVNMYLKSWQRSEFVTSLKKAHVPFIFPPIRKTNMILKNPNFQAANKLWEYLYKYEEDEETNNKNFELRNDTLITGILDDAFLLNYYVISSISISKKTQKEKLTQAALMMLTQQIQRSLALLLNNGIDLSQDELMELITKALDASKEEQEIGQKDIKNKFQSAMDEYLERINKY